MAEIQSRHRRRRHRDRCTRARTGARGNTRACVRATAGARPRAGSRTPSAGYARTGSTGSTGPRACAGATPGARACRARPGCLPLRQYRQHWLAASRAAMDEVAAANNIEIIEFDAQFNPALQQQFQDAIAAGQYAGIILVSLAGAGSIPDVEDALAAGIEVVFLNQVVGEDFTDVEPQVPGVAAAVFEPPFVRGERLGEITVRTCADFDPCNVVYFYGIRGIPLDEAVRSGWDSVTSGSTVNVVAEGEGQYLGPDVALGAMQDILVVTSGIHVVVGADQSMQGVEIALADAGMDDVRIVGFGGSRYAVEAVQDGHWHAELFGAPFTEGRLAMEAMVAALGGTDTGGVDPSLSVPHGGLMFGDNAGDFTSEWDG